MRKFLLALSFVAPLVLGACGGGGGGSIGPPPPPPPVQVIATPGPPNVESFTLGPGPAELVQPAVNTAYLSIQVCVPGTTQCQTIDNIEVDSGSSGLRLLSSTLTQITLPGAFQQPGGLQLAECLPFADGSSFGPLAKADLKLPVSGKEALNITVQVIGDPTYAVPSDCTGKMENTVAAFGANGVLGVGPFLQDCGLGCEQNVIPGTYYTCPTPTTCADASVVTAQQLWNPVNVFASDNNGSIVEVPSVASAGASNVSGSLVFGIGTQTNNSLGSATVLAIDDNTGFFSADFNGTIGLNAALDSGSNAYFVDDSSIMTCPTNANFYCPPSTVNLSATLHGAGGGNTVTASFSIVNADDAFNANQSATAVPGLGGPLNALPGMSVLIQFDLGMPYFFGRNVYTAIENQTASGVLGPYVAY